MFTDKALCHTRSSAVIAVEGIGLRSMMLVVLAGQTDGPLVFKHQISYVAPGGIDGEHGGGGHARRVRRCLKAPSRTMPGARSGRPSLVLARMYVHRRTRSLGWYSSDPPSLNVPPRRRSSPRQRCWGARSGWRSCDIPDALQMLLAFHRILGADAAEELRREQGNRAP